MPVLGDPARLERQRLKRAELVRVHDHYRDYSNHLALVSARKKRKKRIREKQTTAFIELSCSFEFVLVLWCISFCLLHSASAKGTV